MIVLNARYTRILVFVCCFIVGAQIYFSFCSNDRQQIINTPQTRNNIYNSDHEHACIPFWKTHGIDDALKVNDFLDDEPDKDIVIRTRNYNQCFIKLEKELPLVCNRELEGKVYDWLSQISPKVTRSNGKVTDLFDINDKGCFLNQMKSQLSGKGIILTASEFHFRELVHLVMLLRALNTELPVQIIHRGDIPHFNQQKLFQFAKADLSTFSQFQEFLKSIPKPSSEKYKSFPPLDISFVDITECIRPDYRPRFQRFANKLLAYLFNSFAEVILIDVDTVPMIPLREFFELEEYVEKGAFFFKDRSLLNGHDKSNIDHDLLELMPREEDTKFGIKLPTDFTFNQHFFKPGFAHLMESGLVIVDRLRHFDNALMTITLNRFSLTIMEKIHGDKELYWVAMSISGDEDYHFNENFAASVGQLSSLKQTHFPEAGNKIQELCSNHPAHIAKDNHTLLWINTGFMFCKKVMIDETNPFFNGWSLDQMTSFQKAPLKIEAAIIPPVPKVPGLLVNVPESFPDRGWISRPYCESYTLCAYDVVGDSRGLVVHFTEDEQRHSEYLGNVWINSMEVLKELSSKQ